MGKGEFTATARRFYHYIAVTEQVANKRCLKRNVGDRAKAGRASIFRAEWLLFHVDNIGGSENIHVVAIIFHFPRGPGQKSDHERDAQDHEPE